MRRRRRAQGRRERSRCHRHLVGWSTQPPDSGSDHCRHYYHHQRPLSHCLSLSIRERQKLVFHLQPKRATITAQQSTGWRKETTSRRRRHSLTIMIEVVLNDRLGKKIRVKCNEDDTVGDLKKLAAAQLGTRPEKLKIQKWCVWLWRVVCNRLACMATFQ